MKYGPQILQAAGEDSSGLMTAVTGTRNNTQRLEEGALAGETRATGKDLAEHQFTGSKSKAARDSTINKALALTSKKSLNVTGLNKGKLKDQGAKEGSGADNQVQNMPGGPP
jgi:hypothetical protein